MLEAWADPNTARHLQRTGVGTGWRCLELAAGAGSVARWLADAVGPSGAVVAADLNTRFLDDLPGNVEVRQHDIVNDDLEAGAYDLVHSRLLLLHLPEPAAALEKMVRALKPGGWLVAEEADWGMFAVDGHPDAAWASAFVHDLFGRHPEAGVRYPYFGRHLPGLVAAHGLEAFDAEGTTDVTGGPHDTAELYRLTFRALEGLNASVGASEEDLARLRTVIESPGVTITGVTVVAAWGRKS